jgi:hypothetical protein
MAAPQYLNFDPYETVQLAATTSSAGVSFILPASWTDCPDVMVSNAGTTTAFVGFYQKYAPSTQANDGTAAQVPGTGSAPGTLQATPVLAGETMVLTKKRADTCVGLMATGTGTIYFTCGKGN